jgi:hypothetical protein
MSFSATQPKSTLKRAAVLAIAGAILSTMAMASGAEAARSHRQPSAASDDFGGPAPSPAYQPRSNGACLQDEGQGRFSPCESGGAGN